MCLTGTTESAEGAVGSASARGQQGPLRIWSRGNCPMGIPSGSMCSFDKVDIVTGPGGTGSAAMLLMGTAQELLQIAPATELACYPILLQRKSKSYKFLLFLCDLAPRSQPGFLTCAC
jgi:hypothetical protein